MREAKYISVCLICCGAGYGLWPELLTLELKLGVSVV